MSDLGPAGYGTGDGSNAPLGKFNLGHVLGLLTGGNAFGGGFVGDMRGIGHSIMQHYRANMGTTTPAAAAAQPQPGAPSPLTIPPAPGPAPLIQTGPVSFAPTTIPGGAIGGRPPLTLGDVTRLLGGPPR